MGISKKFILKTVGKENMIIPLVDGGVDMTSILNINETAADMYKLLDNGLNPNEVASEIAKEYDAPVDVILKDVLSFIEELKKKGIYND